MEKEFQLPDLGEGIESGDLIQLLVSEGDIIAEEQPVIELETDKAVLEVPCSFAGKVIKIHVAPGDKVPVGATLLTVETEAEPGPQEEEATEKPEAGEIEKEPDTQEAAEDKKPSIKEPEAAKPQGEEREPRQPEEPKAPAKRTEAEPVPAGPATRRLARELGVDIHSVAEANPGVRITEDLVKEFVKRGREVAAPVVSGTSAVEAPTLPDFEQWGSVERVPFTSLQRKTASHLSTGWHLAPHVTQFDQSDVTALDTLRKRYRDTGKAKGIKLTVTAFVLKALVSALKEYPQFNASLDTRNNQLVLKKYYHIGVAVDTPDGLIVPVLRDVEKKSVLQIAKELDELAERTRQRKIGLDELRGGTFTLTNLGGIGGTSFTPIINYPEVAILGLSRSQQQPVVQEGRLITKLMLPLCLSYDHRVINGADGARFCRRMAGLLEDPEMLLLDA